MISACIPYYNRSDMVMETIKPLLADDRIDEIILCDDRSDDINRLLTITAGLPKIRIVRNVINHHVQHNKRNAISFAKNEWCIIVDNDNIIGSDFIDKLFEMRWNPKVIYHPAFAAPNFDYRLFNNKDITRINVKEFCSKNIFMTLLNTNNYFVNRDEYLRVYKYDSSVRGADGIFFAYNWLSAGNTIHIVRDMQYFHRVHDGSEFLREAKTNMELIYYWLDKVKTL